MDDIFTKYGKEQLEKINQHNAELNIRAENKASHYYKHIINEIYEFEKSLDFDMEVGVQLASFGQSIFLCIDKIECRDPSLLVFIGWVDGKKSTLIQHVSQLSFLIKAVQKPDLSVPPKRIGFISD